MTENYGERDWELPCVCGHLRLSHEFGPYELFKGKHGEDSYCRGCQQIILNDRKQVVHKFVLDSLALIEQIARAKGLM